ncbi:MAG: tetratricopeptide repeat protein [Gammaproteobacteria bacterium]|nr:tetratricopeptide repeat protein [Gammaproteobacteria bacterium]MDH4314133.1 tetratricopeptide repeat protein [Gammaproteobacteria bacterium]MDH5212773.1 tetratricopeptide repeat protein [Gammaproteobacteria bacterium]
MMRCLPVLLAVLLLSLNSPASAQSVTKNTFRAIEHVQELMEQERYKEALVLLDALVIETRNIPYDYALANQYLAHTSVILDQPVKARKALESALGVEGIPEDMRIDLKLFYGTVLLGQEEYALATKALEEWLAAAVAPRVKQIFTVSYANYMSGSLGRAEELMARTFGASIRSEIPDSWFQLYYRILFDRKKYPEAERLLFELLARDPLSEQYWRLLASHYLQLEESGDALAAIMLSYFNGLVADPDDLKRIISLYGFIDVPEKAAVLMEEWLAEKKIPQDADALKQLGNLWLLARERDKAKIALEQAASTSADGRTFQMLGGIYFEDEDWAKAHSAYQSALRIGGLEEPLRVSLLSGISAYRAGLTLEARSALQEAAKSSRYKSQAESLLQRLDDA